MKRILQASLLSAACAAASAQTTPTTVTLYGLIDAGIEVSSQGRGTRTREISGGGAGSRWGVRGQEELGGGYFAVFRLESGFATDDGTMLQGGRSFGREASVGLSSRTWGTVLLGRLPVPYMLVQNTVDAFGWIGPGGLLSMNVAGPAQRQVLPMAVNGRDDNSVAYVSPSVGGFQGRALYSLGEGQTNVGRAASLSGDYVAGPLEIVAGWHRQDGAFNTAANGKLDSYVIGATYDFQVAKVHAGYTAEKNSCVTCTGALARDVGVIGTNASDYRVINLGVRVPVGQFVAVAQVVRLQNRSNYAANPGDRDATQVGLGGEYQLSKRTLIYSSVATIGNKNGSNYSIGTGTSQQPALSVGPGNPRAKAFAVGIRHTF